MINLEIKVLAPNLEEIKSKALKMGAINKGSLQQADTYFMVGERRLKLREEKEKSCLIYYLRNNKKESKLSKYCIINVTPFLKQFIKKILSVFWGIKVIVNKKRDLFIYKNTRIHFDNVKNLGTYVELETVFNKNSKEKDLIEEHNFVINFLGLNHLKKVSRSYSDLLMYHSGSDTCT
ncbi:class IV adenylate cyclase [Candidatus Uhrbacteria bacterium]|nr:class IV adenylate cyclase [Candidatus Uhrbacteria bacterium]